MLRSLLIGVFLVFCQQSISFAQTIQNGQQVPLPYLSAEIEAAAGAPHVSEADVPPIPTPSYSALVAAKVHYSRGEFGEAIRGFSDILDKNPKSPDAYAGLTRVYLKQKNVAQAYAIASRGVNETDAPAVHVALGEVYFRQGRILEAAQEWASVINNGYPIARAYWGLSRERSANSFYAQAQELLDRAHELDPRDPDIQKAWVDSQSREEQIQFWENYLASPTNDDAETLADYRQRLDYLKAVPSQSHQSCQLVGQLPSTETKLLRNLTDPTHVRGYTVTVSLNGKKGDLLLDTGAPGIIIDQDLARKAGIVKISGMDFGGIGDKGRAAGYVGYVKSMRIGELEFQNCGVNVVEGRWALGGHGVIGGNVFNSFLVDIDFPREKLRLRPLPKRPDEMTTQGVLQPGKETPSQSSVVVNAGPRDRYIAPEMESYTYVYRFGHELLIPTKIGNSTPQLFAIDTGSQADLLSMDVASENTKVRDTPNVRLKGLNGAVANVYTADKAVLAFGRLRQENQFMTTFDLSRLSDTLGTEVSGILGFDTLQLLEIRIDYRDGVVDLSYTQP